MASGLRSTRRHAATTTYVALVVGSRRDSSPMIRRPTRSPAGRETAGGSTSSRRVQARHRVEDLGRRRSRDTDDQGARVSRLRVGRWQVSVYYSKGERISGVWRLPVGGGLEEPVLPNAPSYGYSRHWALVEGGLYFLSSFPRHQPSIVLRPGSRNTTTVSRLSRAAAPWSSGLAVSPDGRHILIGLEEDTTGDG